MYPKTPWLRLILPEYLEWGKRNCRCPHCGGYGEPNHTKSRGAGGSDLLVVFACRTVHNYQGQEGFRKTEEKFGFLYKDVIIDQLTRFIAFKLLGEDRRSVLPKELQKGVD